MYQIEDVFSPKSFPENTYLMRKSDEYETIDDRFRKALAMKGNLIFISDTYMTAFNTATK